MKAPTFILLLCAFAALHAQPLSSPEAGSAPVDSSAAAGADIWSYGIEFSPARLVLGWLDALGGTTHLSGGFSLFALDRHAEVAFPILYVDGTNDGIPWRIYNVDATYRRFLGTEQRGIYLAGGIRYSHASGAEVLARNVHTANDIVQDRWGAYVGIGARVFWRSGFYYGANIVVGRYAGTTFRHVGDSDIDTGPNIWDAEILKIGYAF